MLRVERQDDLKITAGLFFRRAFCARIPWIISRRVGSRLSGGSESAYGFRRLQVFGDPSALQKETPS